MVGHSLTILFAPSEEHLWAAGILCEIRFVIVEDIGGRDAGGLALVSLEKLLDVLPGDTGPASLQIGGSPFSKVRVY